MVPTEITNHLLLGLTSIFQIVPVPVEFCHLSLPEQYANTFDLSKCKKYKLPPPHFVNNIFLTIMGLGLDCWVHPY